MVFMMEMMMISSKREVNPFTKEIFLKGKFSLHIFKP